MLGDVILHPTIERKKNFIFSNLCKNLWVISYCNTFNYREQTKSKDIQSGEKKRNIVKIDFLIFMFIKIHHIIYQMKLNTIGWTLWWWKLYQKIYYDNYFISLWKRPLKNTSHKKCHFQGKCRLKLFFKWDKVTR